MKLWREARVCHKRGASSYYKIVIGDHIEEMKIEEKFGGDFNTLIGEKPPREEKMRAGEAKARM